MRKPPKAEEENVVAHMQTSQSYIESKEDEEQTAQQDFCIVDELEKQEELEASEKSQSRLREHDSVVTNEILSQPV